MVAKQLRKAFKDAGWQSEAELASFVGEVGSQPAAELAKLLEIMSDPELPPSSAQQRARVHVFNALAELSGDSGLFSVCARALRTADNFTMQMLVHLLPKLNNTAAHAELCEMVGVADPETRRAAAQVLGQVAGVQALSALSKLVRKKDFFGRADAIEAIVPRAGHHAIGLLGAVLEVGSAEEKRRALRHLGDPQRMARDLAAAAEQVRIALADPDERVVCLAIEALAKLVSELEFVDLVRPMMETESIPLIRAIMLGLRHYQSTAAVEFIARKLRLGPNALRLAAIESLEAMACDEALAPLCEALKHTQVVVRNRAAQALANLAAGRQVDVARIIIWLLRSRDVDVRRLAVDIAKKVGDASGELAPKLLHFLRDEDWWVRERVADALVEMMGPNLTKHVAGYLQDPSDVVRRYAVGFLRRLRDPQALGLLVRVMMNDSDWWVREWALEAIADLRDPRTLPYVLEVLKRDPEMRHACFAALAVLQATDAVGPVAVHLNDANAEVRLAAVKCLGAIDNPDVAPNLRALQSDADPRVREHAQEILTRWNAWQQTGANPVQAMSLLDRMLAAVVEHGADDLIMASGRMPMLKHLGKTRPLSNKALTPDQVRALIVPLLNSRQLVDLQEMKDVDFSYEVKTHALRFRAHVFMQMTGLSAVFRTVKQEIPQLESLGLPEIVSRFAEFKNGLVIVGGPTGSGKSTTLAALIDHINRKDSCHIVTLEDPIEVVHTRKESLINQREIGTHTKSFERALRATLRQDPDVILVGEMRDQSTISMAVTAAETGHLVFATVHTVSADASIERIINAFPAAQQPQVRSMLAETLRAVVCQHLLRRRNGSGRVLAAEVMITNDAISNLIRKGKTFQIPSVMATSRELGMQTMDAELIRLVQQGVVGADEAYAKSGDKKGFEAAMSNAEKRPAAAVARPGQRAGLLGGAEPVGPAGTPVTNRNG
jgi:twitching motility protein PilT